VDRKVPQEAPGFLATMEPTSARTSGSRTARGALFLQAPASISACASRATSPPSARQVPSRDNSRASATPTRSSTPHISSSGTSAMPSPPALVSASAPAPQSCPSTGVVSPGCQAAQAKGEPPLMDAVAPQPVSSGTPPAGPHQPSTAQGRLAMPPNPLGLPGNHCATWAPPPCANSAALQSAARKVRHGSPAQVQVRRGRLGTAQAGPAPTLPAALEARLRDYSVQMAMQGRRFTPYFGRPSITPRSAFEPPLPQERRLSVKSRGGKGAV